MDGEDDLNPLVADHEDDVKQLIHGPNGGASNLKAELDRLTRKREAVESETDPVAEIQKQLDMVEEDQCQWQKHINDKRAYAEKLCAIVASLDSECTTLKKQSTQFAEDR